MEIKFRAWSEKYKKLYGNGMYRVWEVSIREDGSLSGNVDETPIAGKKRDGYIPRVYFDKNRKGGGLETQDDDVFILMQYTGLKDKNGVEIYEGDIVVWSKYNGMGLCKLKYQIVWFKDEAGFKGISLEDNPSVLSLNNSRVGMEVIGNIYENKELLEVR